MKNKNGIQLKELILVVILTSLLTSITTGVIMYNNNRITKHINGSDLSGDKDLEEFLKVYASLIGDYYDDINKKEMLEAGIKAMFQYLGEDYTDYLTKNETDALAEKLTGEYRGIGVQIVENNIIYSVFDDSPAKEAGLAVGDKILKVNDVEVNEKSTVEVSKLIQEAKDRLSLEVLRGEDVLSFQIDVKTLLVPVVNYQIISDIQAKIGYLQVTSFSNTVALQVRNALEKLEKEQMSSLILDLRGNTGGYLSQATEIASMFLEKGQLIYSLVDKNDTTKYYDETSEKRDYPIIVLMNDGTASASEILAASLRDSYGAKLLGEVSYGKGKVQQTRTLDDGTMVKYTTARWLRPNGDCIDGVGIKPDVEIENIWNEEEKKMIDQQLSEAIRLLNQS